MVISPGALGGTVQVIESKSDAHRHLICAALSDAPTEIHCVHTSEDIEATRRCLCALGAEITRSPDGFMVRPIARAVASAVLDCGESGSTLRFLLPLAPALGVVARYEAHGRLCSRPNGALIAALTANGARIEQEMPPYDVRGRLQSGTYSLPGNISSQYATGLLLALPRLAAQSEIEFTTPVESRDYIALTLRVMSHYGVAAAQTEKGYVVNAPQRYVSCGHVRVEGDWSAAAFYLAANVIGSDVRVLGLDCESAQADRVMPEMLAKLGTGQPIDTSGAPDLVPALAAAAALFPGETRIVNARRLRLKESDRLSAMRENLCALGADVTETPDGLTLRGGALHGGKVSAYGDHRIAMAMAVAATAASAPVTIEGAMAVAKSYPGFFDDFVKLGGHADVECVR